MNWNAVGAIAGIIGVVVGVYFGLRSLENTVSPSPAQPNPPSVPRPSPAPSPPVEPAPRCPALRLNSCELNTDSQASNIVNFCQAYIAKNWNDPAAYQVLGRAYLALGRLDEAERQFESQLALGVKMNDDGIVGQANFNQAITYYRRTAFDRAEALARKSLALTKTNAGAQAGNYKLLGDIYYKRNNFSIAESNFQSAVDILSSRDDKYGLAMSLVGLGFSKLRNRDRASGCSQLKEARRLFSEANCTKGIREIEKYLSDTRCN